MNCFLRTISSLGTGNSCVVYVVLHGTFHSWVAPSLSVGDKGGDSTQVKMSPYVPHSQACSRSEPA